MKLPKFFKALGLTTALVASSTAVFLATPVRKAQSALLYQHYFQLKDQQSRLCLGVYGNTKNNNAPVIVWGCNGNNDQRWEIVQIGNAQSLRNANGKCIGVSNNHIADNAPLIQWDCNGNEDQNWTIVSTGSSVNFVNQSSSNQNPALVMIANGPRNGDIVKLSSQYVFSQDAAWVLSYE